MCVGRDLIRVNHHQAFHIALSGLMPQNGANTSMPSQSRISAWFAALVVLAGSVFLLEYVVFFNANSGGSSIVSGGRGTAAESWRVSESNNVGRPREAGDRPAASVTPGAEAEAGGREGEGGRGTEEDAALLTRSSLEEKERDQAVAVTSEGEKDGAVVKEERRLAVVVPAHAGDLDRALSSLATWPTKCHASTLANADLVLYYAGGEADGVDAVLPALAQSGGRCFAKTRLVLADLSEEVCKLHF